MPPVAQFPLVLTSPMMSNEFVREAQVLLTKNVFHQDFLQGGAIDGDFGPWTARAVHRAKWWLGYAKPDQVYGEYLHAYLAGNEPLPALKRARRNQRLRALAKKPKGQKVWDRAYSYRGLRENPPGSNRQRFGLRYGWNGVAWCAQFVTVVEYECRYFKGVELGKRWAYVPYVLADAEMGRYGLSLTRFPVVGDWVCFDWGGDGVADHIGFFGGWVNKVRGVFKTVEGNTSDDNTGSQSNGGGVYERTDRHTGQVARTHRGQLGFVHPGRM